ncbi:MAG: sigma 54-interacting transcriptional regulator [Bacillota bacterium]
MEPTVFFAAPTEEFLRPAREAANALGIAAVIEVAELQEALGVARSLVQRGIEAVVSRGGTARLLRDSDLGVPVIEIEVSAYDILRAIASARLHGRRIALVGSENMIYATDEISGLTDTEVMVIKANTYEEVTQKWTSIPEGKVDCVVGDALACRWAEKRSIPSVLIQSGSGAVSDAFRRAREIIEVRREERKRADRVKTMIDSVRDAIVAFDETGHVVVFNRAAESLFGLNASQVQGRHVSTIRSQDFRSLFDSFVDFDQRIVSINGLQVLVKWVPVSSGALSSGFVATLHEVEEIQRMEHKIRTGLHAKGHVARATFSNIIGESAVIREALSTARKYASLDSTVLIMGETGVGKELFAQAIHNASDRSKGPFVAVNCGALPEDLLESELFGYVEGAFTGARKQGKPGLFELAHMGTVFLDEIGHISPRVQLHLLRVLQEREVMRLGSDHVIPVDVRVIAATNIDMAREVREGRMRADLFYRLNVLTLRVPPLRERQGDIPLLADYFLNRYAARLSRKPYHLSVDALKALKAYPFPGNIRELQNVLERAAALCEGIVIDVALIRDVIRSASLCDRDSSYSQCITVKTGPLKQMERDLVRGVLEQVNGNPTKAAGILKVSRTTVWRKSHS